MRILMTGASGFVGSFLRKFLESQGHEVVPFSHEDLQQVPSDLNRFERSDACIHLAGENISEGRWTKAKKKRLFESRIYTTEVLTELFRRLSQPPKKLLCASAVGFYGHSTERKTEKDGAGEGFLASLCQEWEKRAKKAQESGIEVIHLRFGMILGDGGALKKMLPSFRLGLGSILGSGKQFISWIHYLDLARAVLFLLKEPHMKGPFNLCAPYPVRQKEFARTLSAILRRPCFLTLPKWMLKCLFGQMGDEVLLASIEAYPEKLLEKGFSFLFSTLDRAFMDILGTAKKKESP